MSEGRTIVGAGEILWDVYPDGPRFGGAPANFAGSSAALANADDRILIVSAVGTDELGHQAIQALTRHHVDTSALQQNEFETGNVQVTLDDAGVASYRFAENSAWDNLQWTDSVAELAAECDAVCFGTLGQRSPLSRKVIQQFVSATPADSLRILDVNLRDPYWDSGCIVESLELASVLKMNEDELPILASQLKLQGTLNEQLTALAARFDLNTVALTKGPEGAAVLHDGQLYKEPATQTTIVSTVGAGDAFTAALVRGLLNRTEIQSVLRSAIATASKVCASADSILASS